MGHLNGKYRAYLETPHPSTHDMGSQNPPPVDRKRAWGGDRLRGSLQLEGSSAKSSRPRDCNANALTFCSHAGNPLAGEGSETAWLTIAIDLWWSHRVEHGVSEKGEGHCRKECRSASYKDGEKQEKINESLRHKNVASMSVVALTSLSEVGHGNQVENAVIPLH